MLKLFLLALVLYQIELTFEQKLPWAYNLYPYGPDYNDSFTARDQDIGSGLLHLPFNISFMGHKYDQIWVHHAGFLAFQPEAKFTMTDSWPHPNYPSYDDPIFLAPFYCRIELNNDRYQTGMPELDFYRDNDYGRVMFRFVRRPENYILPEPTVFLEGDEKLKKQAFIMLNMAQDQVRDSVSGAEDFVAEYALVATWGNVTFLGISETKLELRPRNSYQVVLVTDAAANHTFAIFNYERIEWAASSEYGGDPSTGLSTTKAARIGFNRGNGTEFFEVLPYSNNPRTILGLHNHSNVNYRGRFIYRVDEWIQPAGCKNEFSNGTLFIWPRFGNMLGGQEVNITGPCFGYHPDPTSDYFVPFEKTYCRWGDEEDSIKTMAEVITMLRARCVMPLIYFNGRTNLWVSTDGGRTYKWKAPFTIVDPIRSPSKVELVNPTEWFKPLPSTNTLAIRWKREDLGWSRNESVEIQLFGYYEDEDGPHWDFLQPLGDYIPNNEYYEFSVRENWAVERQRARRYRMGAVAVTLNSGGTDNPKRIWSQLQPLGWWRHNEMDDYYDREKILLGNSRGSNWMEDQCRWWHEYQRWDRFWMYDLERCPCTIHFAVSDLGRWAPDPECNSDRSMDDPTNCQFHRGAQHCVVSIKPSVTGGGARCCFDFQGNLMYTNDTRFGSTSDRHHIFGIPPYNTYGRVPALSHYLNDIVPYYLCCEWSNLCDSFLYVRETSDCRGYLYPKTAAIYGDPHVMTFDGKDYTFNGKGEFRLVISTRYNFILQARFERPPNATFCVETTGGQINATRMTAIAAREDYSDTIEVRARIHPNQTWRFKCDLFINGQQWYVNFTEEKLQFFRNVSIVAPYNDKYMSNLTIVFNSTGAGVQVSCGYGMLHVKFSASYIMFQETEGLLGIWNNNTDDDFRTPDGDVIPLDAPPQDVNKLFAMKWRIELPADSLFTYSGSLAFDKFHDQKPNTHTWMQFVPWYRWDDPNWRFPTKAPFSESDMLSVCDGDEQCLYDAKAIGILEVGDQTKHAHRYYKFLHEMMKPVNSCGILSIKGAIRRTNTGNYLSGSRMTVSCQPGYTFFGYPEYICNWNGSWLPANGKPLDKFRDWPICEHWQITGFKWSAIAIAIAFTLCILAAIAYRVLVQNKNDKKKQQKNSGEKERLNRNAPIQEEYTDEEGNDERYEQDEETDQDGNYQQDEPVLYRQNYDEDTDGDYYDERTRQQQPRMYKDHEEV